jgi:hypothetical protein
MRHYEEVAWTVPDRIRPHFNQCKQGLRSVRRRAIAHELIGAYRVSARRACPVVGCYRCSSERWAATLVRSAENITPKDLGAEWSAPRAVAATARSCWSTNSRADVPGRSTPVSLVNENVRPYCYVKMSSPF